MDERTVKSMRDGVKKIPTPVLIAVVVVLVFLFAKPWVQVGPGQRGVVLNFGAVQDYVLGEGLHFRIPVVQEVVLLDVKVQKVVTDTVAASADLQDVTSSIALNYHLVPDKANIVYQTIGASYKERIIDPAILEVVKAVSARYSAEELITKRPQVSEAMRMSLTDRLKEYNIAVDAFSIVAFSFSKVFAEAIEAKQTAEQLALKARRDLERVKIEAEQKITAAKAEAESLRLQRANTSPDLIELRRIEANLKAIEKWDGILPQVVGTGGVPLIGLGDVKKR
ncbi:MAG TPA: prohibitin family protein [Smithellaceae bacterium]|jgi:regulator of protease activity HflC (stomatin/prohibitin superfamily)|nr:MAG: FtsH protease regulator HflC [Deltaproteobacteria bacterium ADurb.BinA014]HNV64312.1 prohibitin family protein [Smithellaceae bacterium]HOD31810.1 prohibitin family protein [Smithellaceae bacterium]HOF76696.1 prohibitin family protein [Smithellaceae bacterium]HOM68967.1 prohibitin family protein [Smithellaceae bacterium]